MKLLFERILFDVLDGWRRLANQVGGCYESQDVREYRFELGQWSWKGVKRIHLTDTLGAQANRT
jgi:hypothetical protein